MIIEKQFRDEVNRVLTEKGWSRSELARRMQVDRAYVSNYLNGRNSPGPDVMEKFCIALEMVPHFSLTENPVAVS